MEALLTIKDVALMLNVSRVTITRWWLSGILPGVRIGKLVRFNVKEIEKIQANGLDLNRGARL